MTIRPFRIPKHVILPGIVVRVARASRVSTILNGDDSAWLYHEPEAAATIYLADDLKDVRKQRYALIHELGHVWWDYFHVALKNHPDLFQVC